MHAHLCIPAGDNPREIITVYEALLEDGKDAQGNYKIKPVEAYQ